MKRINILSAIAIAFFLPLAACEHDPGGDPDSGTDPDTSADVEEYGLLSVSTMPLGATVRVNEIVRGVTPVLVEDLAPGQYLVEITLAGYQDFSDTVTVSADSTTPLDITLEPDTPTYDLNGRWSRDSTPDICDVSHVGDTVTGFCGVDDAPLALDGDSLTYSESSFSVSGTVIDNDHVDLTITIGSDNLDFSYTRL